MGANSLMDSAVLDTSFDRKQLTTRMKKQTENHGVGGSIPPLGTTAMFSFIR
jgi:hypothetical protein